MIVAATSERLTLVREHVRRENAHDLAGIMETFGSSATYDDEPWSEHHKGRDAVRSFYEQLMRALPDLEIVVQQEHATDDAVIIECVIRGTHGGPWRSAGDGPAHRVPAVRRLHVRQRRQARGRTDLLRPRDRTQTDGSLSRTDDSSWPSHGLPEPSDRNHIGVAARISALRVRSAASR